MPGEDGIIALNYVYNVAKPDGLTIAAVAGSSALHQLAGVESVKYDVSTFEHLGNAGSARQVFVVRCSLPHRNIEDFTLAKRAIVLAGGAVGSKSKILAHILTNAGYNVTVALGYATDMDRIRALMNGDADASIIDWRCAHKERENVRPLFWLRGKSSPWGNLPNLEELNLPSSDSSLINALTATLDAGQSFVAPPKTSEIHLEVLRKAFEETLKDPNLEAEAQEKGQSLCWINSEKTKEVFVSILRTRQKSFRPDEEYFTRLQ
jgi:tripartite-type tricarboxylate transporter receptor subunit TctC